jgi:hypothetical protein
MEEDNKGGKTQPNYKMALLYASPLVSETEERDEENELVLTDKIYSEIDFNEEFKWIKGENLDKMVSFQQILATTESKSPQCFTKVLNSGISVLHFSGHGESKKIS